MFIQGLEHSGLSSYILAPISGALMPLVMASTLAGTAVASNVFSSTLLELGVSSLAGAAMIHVGATVFDHMPRGSFFYATGRSVNMEMKERLKRIPYESAVGLMMTLISTFIFGVFNLLQGLWAFYFCHNPTGRGRFSAYSALKAVRLE